MLGKKTIILVQWLMKKLVFWFNPSLYAAPSFVLWHLWAIKAP